MAFIKRDIPHYDRFQLPPESDCTYELYSDLIMQLDAEVEADAIAMAKALNRINEERAQHSSKFITDPRSVRLPMKRRPVKPSHPLSYGIPPRLATATTIHGEQLTFRERPEAPREGSKRNSIFASKKNKVLAVPTHQLNSRASQITRVPKSLIEDHKRPATQTTPSPRRILAPRAPAVGYPKIPNAHSSDTSLEARESLLAVTTKKASFPPASTKVEIDKSQPSSLSSRKSPSPPRILPTIELGTKNTSCDSSSPKVRPTAKPAISAATPENLRVRPKFDDIAGSLSVPVTPTPKSVKSRRQQSDDEDTNTVDDLTTNEMSPKPRLLIRKRPEPSIFIQLKRKKI
jgi:elongin-A